MKEKLGKVVKTVVYRECAAIKDADTNEIIVRCANESLAESVSKTIVKFAPGRNLAIVKALGTAENIGRDVGECVDIVTNGVNDACEEPDDELVTREPLDEDPAALAEQAT